MRRFVSLSYASAIVLSGCGAHPAKLSSATAPTPPAVPQFISGGLTAEQLDVAGLRLGMTIEQAKSELVRQNPGIIVLPTYETETYDGGPNPGDRTAGLDSYSGGNRKPRVKVQVGLIAVKVAKRLNDDAEDLNSVLSQLNLSNSEIADYRGGLKILNNGEHYQQALSAYPEYIKYQPVAKKIKDAVGAKQYLTGDWYALYFKPNDNGSALDGVIRTHVYGSPDLAFDRQALPKPDDVTSLIKQSFGDLRVSGGGAYLDKIYDTRHLYDGAGRAFDFGSPEYARCEIRLSVNAHVSTDSQYIVPANRPIARLTDDENPISVYSAQHRFWLKFSKAGGGDARAKEIGEINQAGEFSVPQATSQVSFAPLVKGGVVQYDYRDCGTHLHAELAIRTDPRSMVPYVVAYSVALLDQNAVFTDNGIRDYITSHMR